MIAKDIKDMIPALPVGKERDDVWSEACTIFQSLGFEGVFYADLGPHGGTVLRSANLRWEDDLFSGVGGSQDPLFRHACADLETTLTGPDFLHLHPGLDDSERAFVHAAAHTGLTSGLALPFRTLSSDGVGVWHLLSGEGYAHVEMIRSEAEDPMRHLCAAVRAALGRQSDTCFGDAAPLSHRERECLIWLANGLRTDAIADQLGISAPTVHLHIRNARAKLHAATREEAVAKAFIRGEIHL